MGILPGSGPLGSGPTGPGSGFSVMPKTMTKSHKHAFILDNDSFILDNSASDVFVIL